MASLWNQTQNQRLLARLDRAETFWPRLRGLLGTRELADDRGLWITRCNSIHTFFMSYAIDCIFVDANAVVVDLVRDVRPGRVVWPRWKAVAVVEVNSGSIDRTGVRVGDRLHVGD